MNKVLEFFGVVFLVMAFWTMIAKAFRRNNERSFRHWLDDSED
jgi:hypothetical protein